MRIHRGIALASALLLTGPPQTRAAQEQYLSVSWQQLTERLSRQTVRIELTGGGGIAGQELEPRSDVLLLNVTRAPFASGYSEGPAKVPRSRVASLRAEAGEKARLTLPDGARIEGYLLAARPDGLVMQITKTSDNKRYRKGESEIPRASVGEIRLTSRRGPWRAAGALGGLGAGLLIPVAIASSGDDPEAGVIVAIVAAPFTVVGGLIGGYFAGRAADTRVTVIRVKP